MFLPSDEDREFVRSVSYLSPATVETEKLCLNTRAVSFKHSHRNIEQIIRSNGKVKPHKVELRVNRNTETTENTANNFFQFPGFEVWLRFETSF